RRRASAEEVRLQRARAGGVAARGAPGRGIRGREGVGRCGESATAHAHDGRVARLGRHLSHGVRRHPRAAPRALRRFSHRRARGAREPAAAAGARSHGHAAAAATRSPGGWSGRQGSDGSAGRQLQHGDGAVSGRGAPAGRYSAARQRGARAKGGGRGDAGSRTVRASDLAQARGAEDSHAGRPACAGRVSVRNAAARALSRSVFRRPCVNPAGTTHVFLHAVPLMIERSFDMFRRWVVVTLTVATTGCGYNKIQQLDERAQAYQGQIEVQLQRRADLIPNLVATVKGYAQHEEQVFTNVTNARAGLLGAVKSGDPEQMATANAQLTGALGRLLAVVENYPNL